MTMATLLFDQQEILSPQAESLIRRLKDRARNLYQTRQLLCTEAVVVALNQGLHGGLSESQAIAISAPFSLALGESGCICGALSGAILASGLFMGRDRPYRHRREMRDSARLLHDAFKEAYGSTCCRVITRKVRYDKKRHFLQCGDLTAATTEMAARLILHRRPELLGRVNDGFLSKRQSRIGGTLLRLIHLFSPCRRR